MTKPTDYHHRRESSSPFIKLAWESYFTHDGELTVTADGTWDIVFSTLNNATTCVITGPTTQTVTYNYHAGQYALGIQLREGTFMPGLPAREVINSTRSIQTEEENFFIHGHKFSLPTYDSVEDFVQQLYDLGLLKRDVVVEKGLKGQTSEIPKRSLQRHFTNTTGLALSRHQQILRAQQAAKLLSEGKPIQDVIVACGYFDQSHLTRSLKQFIGVTPQQLTK